MKFQATLSSKGRITIPSEIRRRLGLEPGDRVVFEVAGDVMILGRLREDEANPFAAYAGVLKRFSTREEIDAWLCELRTNAPSS